MAEPHEWATNAQLWRLNACGAIRLVDYPAEQLEEPLTRLQAKEAIGACIAAGLWKSRTRGERQEITWDSVGS